MIIVSLQKINDTCRQKEFILMSLIFLQMQKAVLELIGEIEIASQEPTRSLRVSR